MTNTGRVKTGMPGLDGMLNGGLIRGSMTLVAGNPGTGKSTLATQFIVEGIMRGESGAYMSLEEDKDSFFRNMRACGFDLQSLEAEGKLYFEFFRTEELMRHITDGSQMIDNELRRIDAKRLVVDSITAYLLSCDSELAKRNELKRLFDDMRKWRVTGILTGENRQAESNHGVDYMVDTIIRLHHSRREDDSRMERRIEVEKMRGSGHSEELARMEISEGGIDVVDENSLLDVMMGQAKKQTLCPFDKPKGVRG